MVKEALGKLGGALVPPGLDAEITWRLVVSGTLFALVVVVTLHILSASGMFGSSGFARADEVADTMRLILEEKLDKIYTVICVEDEVDPAIAERARNLQRQFRAVNNGESYVVDCDLLRKMRAATATVASSPPD